MKAGDLAFFYHSNANPSGIVGVMEIVGEPYPDPTQFQPKSEYYDPKSPKDNPRWLARDVVFVEKFKRVIPLSELKATPGLEDMQVVRKGQRLSVMPVEPDEWEIVMRLAQAKV
jgi:predicted RNA-binding protein with PUA-like domain